MSKTLQLTLSFSELTHRLECRVTLTGYIPEAPEKVVTGEDVNTFSIFNGRTLSATDSNAIVGAVIRTMGVANGELTRWRAALDTSDLADTMLASQIDPTVTFEAARLGVVNPQPENPA